MQDKLTIRSPLADQFEDISHIQAISYAYPSGGQIPIANPVGLLILKDGSHIIVTQDQNVFHLKPGWDIRSWKPKAGEPHVVTSDVEPYSTVS